MLGYVLIISFWCSHVLLYGKYTLCRYLSTYSQNNYYNYNQLYMVWAHYMILLHNTSLQALELHSTESHQDMVNNSVLTVLGDDDIFPC